MVRPQATFDLVALALLVQGQPAREPWGPMLLDLDGRRSAIGVLLGDRVRLDNVAELELMGARRIAHRMLRRHEQALVLALESAHDTSAWRANGGASLFAGGELANPGLWLPLWLRAMRQVAREWCLSTAVLERSEEAAA